MKYRIKNIVRSNHTVSTPEEDVLFLLTEEEEPAEEATVVFTPQTAPDEPPAPKNEATGMAAFYEVFPFLRSTKGKAITAGIFALILLLAILLPSLLTGGKDNTPTPTTPSTTNGAAVNCNHIFKAQTVKEATCTTQGAEKNVCELCGFTKDQVTLQALGHDMQTETRDAECGKPGEVTKRCSRCDLARTEELPAMEHEFEETGRKEATCSKEGEIRSVCKYCKEIKREPIPVGEHDMQESARTEATCIREGKIRYTCTVCGKTEYQVLHMVDHVFAPATCIKPETCELCSVTRGAVTEHDYAPATCLAPSTCTVCGITTGGTIGHRYENGLCTTCYTPLPYTGSRLFYVRNGNPKALAGSVTLTVQRTFDLVEADGKVYICLDAHLTYGSDFEEENYWLFQDDLSVRTASGKKLDLSCKDLFSDGSVLYSVPTSAGTVQGKIYIPFEGAGEYLLDVNGREAVFTFALNISPINANSDDLKYFE